MTPAFLQSVFTDAPSLAFIFFIAFSLLVALGARFAVYAHWNRRRTSDATAQVTLWTYLVFIGVTAALYGILGALEAATAVVPSLPLVLTPYRDGILLAFLLLLALTMGEIHRNEALSNGGETVLGNRVRLELGLGLVVTVSMLGTLLVGGHTAFDVIEAVAALGVGAYGLVYGRRQLENEAIRGTVVDSLLRHLLPVVVFMVLVLVIDVTTLVYGPLTVEVVRHIQVVFVIMTATALMTATIKLRQNVASL